MNIAQRFQCLALPPHFPWNGRRLVCAQLSSPVTGAPFKQERVEGRTLSSLDGLRKRATVLANGMKKNTDQPQMLKSLQTPRVEWSSIELVFLLKTSPPAYVYTRRPFSLLGQALESKRARERHSAAHPVMRETDENPKIPPFGLELMTIDDSMKIAQLSEWEKVLISPTQSSALCPFARVTAVGRESRSGTRPHSLGARPVPSPRDSFRSFRATLS